MHGVVRWRLSDLAEWAMETGDNLDAKLVLLTLHAKVIQPSVVYRFQLETGAS